MFIPRKVVLLCGQNLGVLIADLLKATAVGRTHKVPQRVATEKRKTMLCRELVPGFLQTNGPTDISILPQDVQHLCERTNHSLITHCADLFDLASYVARESVRIRHPVIHELPESFA